MTTNLTDYPSVKVKHPTPLAGARKKHSTSFYSWDFEMQESDVQETYQSHENTLMYNDLNAYVVDWEMPK